MIRKLFFLFYFVFCSNIFAQDSFPNWTDYTFGPKNFTHFVKPKLNVDPDGVSNSGFRSNPQIDRKIKRTLYQDPDSSWIYVIGTGSDTTMFYMISEWMDIQGFVEDTSNAATNVNITIRLYCGSHNLKQSKYVPDGFGVGGRNYVLIDSKTISSEGAFYWEFSNYPKGGWLYYTVTGNGTNNDTRLWMKQRNYTEHIQSK